MAWMKMCTVLAVLGTAIFLRLQLRDTPQEDEQSLLVEMNEPAEEASGGLRRLLKHVAFAALALRDVQIAKAPVTRGEYLALGSLYLAVALVAWAASTYDYYTSVSELEREQLYLDETENRTRPAITAISCAIGCLVIGTAILMLVRHEGQ